MSYIIGRGRTARETYPEAARSTGGGGGCPPAVVFDPSPPCTPTTSLRSNRSANQSPIAEPVVGATNLGSDTSGVSVGVTGNYATVLGGDQNTATADYATVVGGSENTAGGETSFLGGGFGNKALGGNSAIGGGEFNIASGASSSIASGNDSTVAGDGAAMAGGEGNTAFGAQSAVAGSSNNASGNQSVVGGGTGNSAGYAPVSFTISAGGTLVTIAGDFTTEFANGDSVSIQPTAPKTTASTTSLTVTSVPAFGGINTTFNLSGPIDGTTLGGLIVDTAMGAGSVIPGGSNNTTTGINSHAIGEGAVASRFGQDTLASGDILILGSQTSRIVLSAAVGTGDTNQSSILAFAGGISDAFELENQKNYMMSVEAVLTADVGGTMNTSIIKFQAAMRCTGGVAAVAGSGQMGFMIDGDAALLLVGSGGAIVSLAFAPAGSTVDLTLTTNGSVAVNVAARLAFTEITGTGS